MKHLKVTILLSSCFLMSLLVWASEGVLYTTFHSPDGYVLWDGGSGYDRGRDIALQQNGKILVTGYMTDGTDNDLMVIRYNRDGTLYAGFGTNGAYIYDGGNGNDGAYAIAVQSDNKILRAGDSSNGSDGDVLLLRLDTDGNLDTSFGTNGIVLYDGGDYDRGFGIDTNSNGNILVTGVRTKPDQDSTDYDIPVICFNSNGNLDTSFGNNGITLYNGGTREQCYDLMVQGDDTILVAGHSGNSAAGPSDWSLVVLKYDPNGTLDTTFGTNGVYQYDPTDNTEWGYGLALQTDGKIVVTGQAYNGTDDDVIVLRLTNSVGDSNEPNEPNDIS